MTPLRAVAAELGKLANLPATLVAVAVSVVGTLGIGILNASGIRRDLESGHADALGYLSPVDAAFSAIPIGIVGAVIIGVVAISSDYTSNSTDAGGGRQITATLTAVPNRTVVLIAKAVAVTALVTATCAIVLPSTLLATHLIVGDLAPQNEDVAAMVAHGLGATLYDVLTALIALSITTLTRSGIIPLLVLIANSSLVSVSLLLSKVTPLAFWLPDLAGMRLFASESVSDLGKALAPLPGGITMGAWTLALLVVAGVVFARRDA